MFQIASFKIICTDSTEILFSKLRSAGLNFHLPKRKFFTFPYCAGVSNKHCLLTFFILLVPYVALDSTVIKAQTNV